MTALVATPRRTPRLRSRALAGHSRVLTGTHGYSRVLTGTHGYSRALTGTHGHSRALTGTHRVREWWRAFTFSAIVLIVSYST